MQSPNKGYNPCKVRLIFSQHLRDNGYKFVIIIIATGLLAGLLFLTAAVFFFSLVQNWFNIKFGINMRH